MTRVVVLALALALAACGGGDASKALPADEAAQLLINRNWMDLWPETESERLHVLRFVPAMGGGVYQDRTLFAGQFELFTFQVKGEHIHFDLPHTKDTHESTFKIERVSGPEPFDLKLTLDPTPRGPAAYFGRSAETADTLEPLAPLR